MRVQLQLLVEGETEQDFVTQILTSHLARFDVIVRNPMQVSSPTVARLVNTVNKLNHFCTVTTLFDYYAFPHTGCAPWATANELELQLSTAQLNACQTNSAYPFIPYIQQYEFEALLFSDITSVCNYFSLSKNPFIEEHTMPPETINGGFDTCPSRRMIQKLGKPYSKPIHGVALIEKIGLPTIRQKCPRFDAWLTRLEGLGSR